MTKKIINTDTLRKLAVAAAIDLDEESILEYTQYLIKIIDYIDEVGPFNCDEEVNLSKVIEVVDCREDTVKDLLARDDFLANAPDQLGGMVKVPVVIK